MEGCQTVAVLDQFLLPANHVHVFQQHLYLSPDEQTLERRVVEIHVLDVDLFHLVDLTLDAGQRGLHVAQLAMDREGE